MAIQSNEAVVFTIVWSAVKNMKKLEKIGKKKKKEKKGIMLLKIYTYLFLYSSFR